VTSKNADGIAWNDVVWQVRLAARSFADAPLVSDEDWRRDSFRVGYTQGAYFSLLAMVLGNEDADKIAARFQDNLESGRRQRPSEPSVPPVVCEHCGTTDGPFVLSSTRQRPLCEDCAAKIGVTPESGGLVRGEMSPSGARMTEIVRQEANH
jgi:hypothetical protein